MLVSPSSLLDILLFPRAFPRDEFADIKSVKLLRRGRRLQEVEQVYGKTPATGNSSSSTTSLSSSLSDHQRRQSAIPSLDAKFFASPFFARFDIQRASFLKKTLLRVWALNNDVQTHYWTRANSRPATSHTSRVIARSASK